MAEVNNSDVLQNDKYGRYLVAKKDVTSGELIFTDTPFVVGPKPGKCQIPEQAPAVMSIIYEVIKQSKDQHNTEKKCFY